jgi:transketolase C-terminal domain/subunit
MQFLNIRDLLLFDIQRATGHEFDGSDAPIEFGKGVVLKEGTSVTLIGVGKVMDNYL